MDRLKQNWWLFTIGISISITAIVHFVTEILFRRRVLRVHIADNKFRNMSTLLWNELLPFHSLHGIEIACKQQNYARMMSIQQRRLSLGDSDRVKVLMSTKWNTINARKCQGVTLFTPLSGVTHTRAVFLFSKWLQPKYLQVLVMSYNCF